MGAIAIDESLEPVRLHGAGKDGGGKDGGGKDERAKVLAALPLAALPLAALPLAALPLPMAAGGGLRREALALPAILLARLPAPPRLGLHVPGLTGVVRVDPIGEDDDGDPDDVVFDADEWAALVVATEADRVWPADFRTFCGRKRAEPEWRLELPEALAGGQPDRRESWDLGRVLRRLGANVLSLES